MTLCASLMILGSMITTSVASDEQKEPLEWGPEAGGCRFSVMANQASYRFDQPISLRLMLKNIGDGPVKVEVTDLMMVYRFDVRLPDGKPAPLTLEGTRQTNIPADKRSFDHMEPGQTIIGAVPMLNRLYDMTLLGEYTVTVYRHVT